MSHNFEKLFYFSLFILKRNHWTVESIFLKFAIRQFFFLSLLPERNTFITMAISTAPNADLEFQSLNFNYFYAHWSYSLLFIVAKFSFFIFLSFVRSLFFLSLLSSLESLSNCVFPSWINSKCSSPDKKNYDFKRWFSR